MSGGAYSYVIKNQSITASNGPLPASFRVGFAGSDGGASNIHEIMCFKAASAVQSGSSATVNEKESAKVQAGTQAYFAYYNPNDWTGTVTGNNLLDSAGVISVSTTANWDASCVLSGTASGAPASGGGCATTNVSGPTTATPGPTNRVMLTWDTVNGVGIPFEWVESEQRAAGGARFRRSDQHSLPAELSARRHQQRDQFLRSRPVPRARHHPRRYRRFEPHLGRSAVLALHDNVEGPSEPGGGDAGKQRHADLSAVHHRGADTSQRGVRRLERRLSAWLPRRQFRCASATSSTNGATPNDGQEVLAYMPGSSLVSSALPSAPAAAPTMRTRKRWCKASTA